jgi:hypothetical protein
LQDYNEGNYNKITRKMNAKWQKNVSLKAKAHLKQVDRVCNNTKSCKMMTTPLVTLTNNLDKEEQNSRTYKTTMKRVLQDTIPS